MEAAWPSTVFCEAKPVAADTASPRLASAVAPASAVASAIACVSRPTNTCRPASTAMAAKAKNAKLSTPV